MSRSLGNAMPPTIVTLLDGNKLDEKAHLVCLLLTQDAEGYPRPAMLSVGEVLARGPSDLRLALYDSSSTTANLRRSGKLTLVLSGSGVGYYVRATARDIAVMDADLAGLAVFDAVVEEVLEDGEPIAEVTSGFTMRLTGDGSRVIAMWEATVRALRRIP
jgi:hypothetical protein